MREWGQEVGALRDRTDTTDRTRARRLIILGPVTVYALVGVLSRLFGRGRKDPVSEVDRVVREVRGEMGRGREPAEEPTPTPEQVRKRREERRRREAEEAHR